MSCPEVMYQAYYPYLYQRASTSATSSANMHRAAHFTPFTHQYDRFNVQRSLDQPSTSTSTLSTESYHIPHHSHTPSHHSSAGSVSSNGGVGSPGSPSAVPIRYKEEETTNSKDSGERREVAVTNEDDDDDAGSTSSNSRAQYVSANCVVFTHYSGDVAAVVDEHFTRALNYASDLKNNVANTKEFSPMTARNFPPSFWNSNYQAVSVSSAHHSDFYGGESAYHAAVAAAAAGSTAGADPWHSHYQQYAAHHHHRAVHDYHHHHNMAAQYSSLLIPPASRLPAHVAAASHPYHHGKTGVEHWSSSHSAASHHRLHHEQSTSHHALDATTSPYSTYSPMTGLEAQVQESSKDLYWF